MKIGQMVNFLHFFLPQDELAACLNTVHKKGQRSLNCFFFLPPQDELAACLTAIHEKGQLNTLMKRCPVDGADLVQGDDFGNLIYMTLCMDEGTGVSLQVRREFRNSRTLTSNSLQRLACEP